MRICRPTACATQHAIERSVTQTLASPSCTHVITNLALTVAAHCVGPAGAGAYSPPLHLNQTPLRVPATKTPNSLPSPPHTPLVPPPCSLCKLQTRGLQRLPTSQPRSNPDTAPLTLVCSPVSPSLPALWVADHQQALGLGASPPGAALAYGASQVLCRSLGAALEPACSALTQGGKWIRSARSLADVWVLHGDLQGGRKQNADRVTGVQGQAGHVPKPGCCTGTCMQWVDAQVRWNRDKIGLMGRQGETEGLPSCLQFACYIGTCIPGCVAGTRCSRGQHWRTAYATPRTVFSKVSL